MAQAGLKRVNEGWVRKGWEWEGGREEGRLRERPCPVLICKPFSWPWRDDPGEEDKCATWTPVLAWDQFISLQRALYCNTLFSCLTCVHDSCVEILLQKIIKCSIVKKIYIYIFKGWIWLMTKLYKITTFHLKIEYN